MRSRPARLTDADLVAALDTGWSIAAASVSYLPVGAGSHHWRVEDRRDQTWFVTVDELDARRDDPRESRADVFDRLTAALVVPHALQAAGADYVVAPIAERSGAVVQRLGDEWALAVYPMIDGDTFHGGQALPVADRLAVVQVIARLHRGPSPIKMSARSDDYRLQNRADLEAAIVESTGPSRSAATRHPWPACSPIIDPRSSTCSPSTTTSSRRHRRQRPNGADPRRTPCREHHPHAGRLDARGLGHRAPRRAGTRPVAVEPGDGAASRSMRRQRASRSCPNDSRCSGSVGTSATSASTSPVSAPPRAPRRRRSGMGRHLPDPEPPNGRRPRSPSRLAVIWVRR